MISKIFNQKDCLLSEDSEIDLVISATKYVKIIKRKFKELSEFIKNNLVVEGLEVNSHCSWDEGFQSKGKSDLVDVPSAIKMILP